MVSKCNHENTKTRKSQKILFVFRAFVAPGVGMTTDALILERVARRAR